MNINMNNTLIQTKCFLTLLDEFYDFLEMKLPLFRSDIILTRTYSDTMKAGNPRIVVNQFMGALKPFETKIMNCDEHFFLDFERNIKLEKEIQMIGARLKKYWLSEDLTIQDRAYIWGYIQGLLKIGNKI